MAALRYDRPCIVRDGVARKRIPFVRSNLMPTADLTIGGTQVFILRHRGGADTYAKG
jgi:hypothetical protein